MKKNVTFFLTGIFLGLTISGGIFTLFLFLQREEDAHTNGLISAQTNNTLEEMRSVLDSYLPAPQNTAVQDAFLHGFVSSYDEKYTTYFSPEELLSFTTYIEGDFEGIGAYVEDHPEGIYISGVLPDSPAQKGGLLPGDIIESVNGESMQDKTADYAVQKIRGPSGSQIVLHVFSTALSTRKEVTLIRQKLEIPIISDELIDDVLYIRLTSFNNYSAKDVREVLQKHQGKFTAVLFDLRNNGGGTLQAAVEVGSLFIANGKTIASIEGKEENITYTSQGSTDSQIPIFVLINGQTASAAEILASALKVHIGAVLLGSTTYGKGSVQELFPLKNGGQLKITTALWKTADGKALNKIGLEPDNFIPLTAEDITTGEDGQREKAIQLINENV